MEPIYFNWLDVFTLFGGFLERIKAAAKYKNRIGLNEKKTAYIFEFRD